jgi:hypothetical protein
MGASGQGGVDERVGHQTENIIHRGDAETRRFFFILLRVSASLR